MKAVVIGSSGTIGKAVAKLLKDKGYQVVEACRSTTPAINIAEPSTIDDFYDGLGQVDVIICAAGEAAFVALDKLSDEQVQVSIKSKLLGQVNIVRKGLKNLAPGGVFVITGGMLAYVPWPQTAMITMVNSGLEGFIKAAALDLTGDRRVVIVHPPWVAETAARLGMDATKWPNASKTAEAYLEAVESDKNGEPVFVEGYHPGTIL